MPENMERLRQQMLGQRKQCPYVVIVERTEGIPSQVPEPSSVDATRVNKTREGAGEEVNSVEDEAVVRCSAIKP